MASYAESMVAESCQLYCGLVQQRLHDSAVTGTFTHSFTQQLIAPQRTEASAGHEAETNCLPWLPHLLQVLKGWTGVMQVHQAAIPGLEERARMLAPLVSLEQMEPSYFDAPGGEWLTCHLQQSVACCRRIFPGPRGIILCEAQRVEPLSLCMEQQQP